MLNQYDPGQPRQILLDPRDSSYFGYGAPVGYISTDQPRPGETFGGGGGGGGFPIGGSGGSSAAGSSGASAPSAAGGTGGGGFSMPSWAGDAISAGGSLLGGWLQSRSQNKATESQERMFNSAMKAQRRAEFEERARLAVMWEAWNARRQQLMARYGLDIPPSTNPFTEPESQLPQKYGQNLADLGGGGGGGGEWDSSQGRI